MTSRKICQILCLLALWACTRDKKNDSRSSPIRIDAAELAMVHYEYGGYGSGFKSYQLNLESGLLIGTWNRREIHKSEGTMVMRTGNVILTPAQLSYMNDSLNRLNDAIVPVDPSQCGTVADGPASSLLLTSKKDLTTTIHIAEVKSFASICADSYVVDDSLQSIKKLFFDSLPEPELP